MKNPKIIYYSPHPTHDIVSEVGYATHQRETIEALRELGCEVLPVVMGGTKIGEVKFNSGMAQEATGLKKLIKSITPKFVWISLKDLKLLMHDKKAAAALEKAMISFQPNLVYERSELLQDRSVAVIKKYKVPYFVEVNAPFVEEMRRMEGFSFLHWLALKKEKNKYALAQRVFTVSNALKQFLIKEYSIDANKILVAPNRINVQNFSGGMSKTGPLTIGFVGSILPFHKLDLLIHAFSIVAKENSEIQLLIVGEGSGRQQMQELAKSLDLDRQVRFTGAVKHEKVYEEIAKMDICVMPGSNWYGSPVKIFEYGAMEKMIIAPRLGPLEDVMIDGVDGLLVEENAVSIARGIRWYMDNPIEGNTMAKNFSTKVRENYQWKQAAKEILDSLQEVANIHAK